MGHSPAEHIQQGFSVRGRVQGVGFRWWTRTMGSDLGLVGAVRNLPDGSVEAHVAGPAQAVQAFAAELARGPLGAQVDRVERIVSDRPLPSDFVIE